ncbi:hypothetical protein DJ480_09980 [Pseudomonas sp. Leaf98]|nr:hypothetical protein DJ480_09980 [Pseudomonas sp. Leaf98]
MIPCGSWLACDADNSVYQLDRGDAIAGKPAPTFVLCFSRVIWIVPTEAVGRVWQMGLWVVSLPTAKPESPGLCVWMGVSKVLGSLNVQ